MSALAPFLTHFGTKSAVARAMGVTDQAIQKWEAAIPVRPTNRVLQLCREVRWRVTPHEVAPDVYPHPEDGLPAKVRRRMRRVTG